MYHHVFKVSLFTKNLIGTKNLSEDVLISVMEFHGKFCYLKFLNQRKRWTKKKASGDPIYSGRIRSYKSTKVVNSFINFG